MRTFLMLSLVLVMAIPAVGQITIATNTFTPAVGTTITTYSDTSVTAAFYDSVTAGTGGPMVWDFTGKPFPVAAVGEVVSVASAPTADSFPGANFVLMTVSGGDTIWSFSNSATLSFSTMGNVVHSQAGTFLAVYKDATPEYVFPIALNNQWTSHRSWSQTFLTTRTEITDTTTYNVDAWGTVKYNTNVVSVLRVMADTRMHTRTFVGGFLVDSMLTQTTSANFIAPGTASVVSVSKTSIGGTTDYGASASSDFVGSPTDVLEDNDGTLPSKYGIDQNYPNPFNPNTAIRFSLPTRSDVRLAVYNIAGQEVKVLVDQSLGAGSYITNWDGTSASGRQVASGVYYYRLQAGQYSGTKKMVLLK